MKWQEVATNEQYVNAPLPKKQEIRNDFLNRFVLPKVPTQKKEEVSDLFLKKAHAFDVTHFKKQRKDDVFFPTKMSILPKSRTEEEARLAVATARGVFGLEGINNIALNRIKSMEEIDAINKNNPIWQEKKAKLIQDMETTRGQAVTIFGQQKVDQWQKEEPISWSDMNERLTAMDYMPYLSTGKQITQLAKLNNIKNKKVKGELLTKGEEEYFKGFIENYFEMQVRGVSFKGQFAQALPEMTAFIGEFVGATFTGGIGSAALAAKAATKAGIKGFAKKAIVEAATITGTTLAMPQRVAEGYLERRLHDGLSITDKGDVVLSESKEKPATAFAKSLLDMGIEVASERSGLLLGRGVGAIFKKVKPKGFRIRFLSQFKKMLPKNQKLADVFANRGIYNGVLIEFGEERVGELMRVATGLNEEDIPTFDKYMNAIFPNKEQALLELGLFTIMGAGSLSTQIVANKFIEDGKTRDEVEKIMKNTSELEKESIAKNIYQELNGGRPMDLSFLDTLAEEGETAEQAIPKDVQAELEKGPVPQEVSLEEIVPRLQAGETVRITPETVQEIKDTLKIADKRIPAAPRKNLLSLLRKRGITPESTGRIDRSAFKEAKVFNKKGGISIDKMAQFLMDEGYMPQRELNTAEEVAQAETEANEIVNRALAGEKIYSELDQPKIEEIGRAEEYVARAEEIIGNKEYIKKILPQISKLTRQGYETIDIYTKDGEIIVEGITDAGRVEVAKTTDISAILDEITKDKVSYAKVGKGLKSVLSAFEEGVKQGKKITKAEIKNVQSALVDFIKKSDIPQTERGVFLTIVKNIQTIEQLEKAIPKIEEKIDKILEKSEQKELIKKIKKELDIKPEFRQGAIKKGRYDYSTNQLIKEAKSILKLNQEKAQEGLYNTPLTDELVSFQDKFLRKLLSYKANGVKSSNVLLREVLSDIKRIKEIGRKSKSAKEFEKEIDKNENINEVKNSVQKTNKILPKWTFDRYNNIIGNFYDVFWMLGGKNLAEKYDAGNEQQNKANAIYKTRNKVITKSSEILGIKKSEFLQKMYDMTQKIEDVTLAREDGLVINPSKLQLIDMYLMMKNAETAELIDKNYGYTEVNNLILENLTEEELNFANYMQSELQPYGELLNEMSIKMNGVELSLINNYWMRTSEKQKDINVFNQYKRDSQVPSALKQRALSVVPVPRNAWAKFNYNIEQAEHLKYLGEMYQELDQIFSDPILRQEIENKHGRKLLRLIDEKIKDISLNRKTQFISEYEKMTEQMLARWVAVQVASETVFAKQLISAPIYVTKMPVKDFVKYFTEGVSKPRETAKFMKNNIPMINERYEKGFDDAVEKAIRELESTSFYDKHIAKKLLSFTKTGDIGAIIYGGYAYVKYLEAQGKSMKEINQDFQKFSLRTQQSRHTATLSETQKARSLSFFSRFKNTPNQYLRLIVNSYVGFRRGEIPFDEFAKTITMILFIQSALFKGTEVAFKALYNTIKSLISGEEKEELDKMEVFYNWINQMLTTPFNAVPFAGDLAKYGLRSAEGLYPFEPLNTMMIGDLNKSVKGFTSKAKNEDLASVLYYAMTLQEPIAGFPVKKIYKLTDIGTGGKLERKRKEIGKQKAKEKRQKKKEKKAKKNNDLEITPKK